VILFPKSSRSRTSSFRERLLSASESYFWKSSFNLVSGQMSEDTDLAVRKAYLNEMVASHWNAIFDFSYCREEHVRSTGNYQSIGVAPTHNLPFTKVNLPVLILVGLVHKFHEMADDRSIGLQTELYIISLREKRCTHSRRVSNGIHFSEWRTLHPEMCVNYNRLFMNLVRQKV
jgi:hypothetical protein